MYWPRRITVLIIFMLFGIAEASAQHPICGRAPEWDIKSQDTESLKGDLQGKAQLLTKLLGSANLSGQIQTERETLYKNSDEPEARRQDAYLAYMFCVLIMDDRTLSINEKIKAINEFKQPVRKSESLERMFAAPMVPCLLGELVLPRPETFHLQFLVVDDGPVVRSIMPRVRSQNLNAGRELGDAIKAGTIPRLTDSASLIVHLLGVNSQKLPSHVPYLAGNAVCQGMVPVAQSALGTSTISIPIGGNEHRGQTAIVLPRDVLKAAARPQVCVEPNFPLAYPRQITEEPFRGRLDMTCGWEGKLPGSTGLSDSLREGKNSHTYFFVRRI
jgi:hypothetical protein